MLQVDAKKRITIENLLTHPWLMEGYDRPIKWQSKYHGNDIDSSIVEEMAVYKLTTVSSLTERLKRWEYDYQTATYLLMFEKKQKGLAFKSKFPTSTTAPYEVHCSLHKRPKIVNNFKAKFEGQTFLKMIGNFF